ncbi:MAG: hypothetical protein V4819_09065 [Verrucomicrobiota bacterium]
MTEATSNARQFGLALFEFQDEYGKYPDLSTAAEVRRKTGSALSLSDETANDLFAQLLAGRFTQTEKIFYTKAKFSKRPDDIWSSDATVLAHGECAFAYIMGVDPKGDPETPLAFGPVIPGTKTFDGKANEGKIVVLRIDNSVTSIPIHSSGKVLFRGLDFLDPRQPFWNGKAPDVKWPK